MGQGLGVSHLGMIALLLIQCREDLVGPRHVGTYGMALRKALVSSRCWRSGTCRKSTLHTTAGAGTMVSVKMGLKNTPWEQSSYWHVHEKCHQTVTHRSKKWHFPQSQSAYWLPYKEHPRISYLLERLPSPTHKKMGFILYVWMLISLHLALDFTSPTPHSPGQQSLHTYGLWKSAMSKVHSSYVERRVYHSSWIHVIFPGDRPGDTGHHCEEEVCVYCLTHGFLTKTWYPQADCWIHSESCAEEDWVPVPEEMYDNLSMNTHLRWKMSLDSSPCGH